MRRSKMYAIILGVMIIFIIVGSLILGFGIDMYEFIYMVPGASIIVIGITGSILSIINM